MIINPNKEVTTKEMQTYFDAIYVVGVQDAIDAIPLPNTGLINQYQYDIIRNNMKSVYLAKYFSNPNLKKVIGIVRNAL